MKFLKIRSYTWWWNLKGVLPLVSQNDNFPPLLSLHRSFISLLIFKISITERPFIKMRAIKRVHWRKLLYTPVGGCWFFTFVYSAKIKYLVLKSRRWLGDLNILLAAEVWHIVKLMFTNLCHQQTQETFLDYRRWKFKPLEKLPAKDHIFYIISFICYCGEIVLACFPTVTGTTATSPPPEAEYVQRQSCYSVVRQGVT